jgi:hypothetical protein
MRIFYGVYLDDIRLSACLDLIRLLGEPDYYRRCHITVRGPYERRLSQQDLFRFNDTLRDVLHSLTILGVGSFFFGQQNTVILEAEIVGLKDIWHKPSYQDGKPHLTLFDGKSKQMGLAIRATAKKYNWNITTKISDLQIIEKKTDVLTFLDTYYGNVWDVGRKLFGENFSMLEVYVLSPLDRIARIDVVCQHVQRHFSLRPRTFNS